MSGHGLRLRRIATDHDHLRFRLDKAADLVRHSAARKVKEFRWFHATRIMPSTQSAATHFRQPRQSKSRESATKAPVKSIIKSRADAIRVLSND